MRGFLMTIAAVALLAQGCAARQVPVFLELSSPYGFDETIDRVTAEAKAAGWKVPGIGKVHENLAKAGKTIDPVAIINLCHPDHAERLLEDDGDRVASALMPCRVSVYVTSNGVRASLLHPDFLAAHLDGVPGAVIPLAARENVEFLRRALAPTDTE
jgi:uncharacterized protein (DUF302 family)